MASFSLMGGRTIITFDAKRGEPPISRPLPPSLLLPSFVSLALQLRKGRWTASTFSLAPSMKQNQSSRKQKAKLNNERTQFAVFHAR